jgi:poly-gamma-glutamate capsule biosynthesis protein CapA/YwtB (metallophosphatase superfamily)
MHHIPSLAIILLVPIYVLGVFAFDVFVPNISEETPQAPSIQLSFVGDMMFDRYVRERHNSTDYVSVLEKVSTLFTDSDIVIGNLEGPITTFASVSDWRDGGPNHYKFTFATSVASTLHTTGFTTVSLANNHSMNFGSEGLVQTKDWLTKNNLQYIGAPDELYVPLRNASSTPRIALYAFDQWHAKDVGALEEQLKKELADTFVVVYAHWGDEYEKAPNAGQKEFAHRFIDAGADFVVGSHPHVVQTKELYKEKWIYYSLGNFVFDQYFNKDVTCGAVLTLTLDASLHYEIEERFIELERNGTTKISDCAERVEQEK